MFHYSYPTGDSDVGDSVMLATFIINDGDTFKIMVAE